MHSAAHSRIDYTIREEESHPSESLLSHYIGVYDPDTQQLQLVPARKATIRATPRSDTGNESVEEDPAPNVTFQPVPETSLASNDIFNFSSSPHDPTLALHLARKRLKKLSDPLLKMPSLPVDIYLNRPPASLSSTPRRLLSWTQWMHQHHPRSHRKR